MMELVHMVTFHHMLESHHMMKCHINAILNFIKITEMDLLYKKRHMRTFHHMIDFNNFYKPVYDGLPSYNDAHSSQTLWFLQTILLPFSLSLNAKSWGQSPRKCNVFEGFPLILILVLLNWESGASATDISEKQKSSPLAKPKCAQLEIPNQMWSTVIKMF